MTGGRHLKRVKKSNKWVVLQMQGIKEQNDITGTMGLKSLHISLYPGQGNINRVTSRTLEIRLEAQVLKIHGETMQNNVSDSEFSIY